MAVTADVLVATAAHQKGDAVNDVHLANTDPEKFESRTFTVSPTEDVQIDSSTLEWTNYFKAGLLGATQLLQRRQPGIQTTVGMDVLVDGTVPSGGGLSSSAAFVCASALAVLRTNGMEHVSKKELVELAIVSERAVGVNSGGMDQAASVFAEQGSALYVSFVPELSAKQISFPRTESPLTFVVAQSFVAADKHVAAPVNYNLRVVEVTLAARVLASISGLTTTSSDASPLGFSLRSFHDTYMSEKEHIADQCAVSKEQFQLQLQDLIHKVDQYLPQEEGYDREQLSFILRTTVDEIEERYMKTFPVRAERFKIRQRALHVFSEAVRVLRFNELLSQAPPQTEQENSKLLTALGELLNESHESCRELYENSCNELDELCSLARSAGAYGSRLTGAVSTWRM